MAVSDLEAFERFVRADAGCVLPCLGVEEMLVQRSSVPRQPKTCPGMILLKAVSPDGELEGRTKFIREPHCRTGFSGRVPDARQPPSASVCEAKYNASPRKDERDNPKMSPDSLIIGKMHTNRKFLKILLVNDK